MKKNKILFTIPVVFSLFALFTALSACNPNDWDSGGEGSPTGKDSLTVWVVLEKTDTVTGTLTLQVINSSDEVAAARTIDAKNINWKPLPPNSSPYYNGYTSFVFSGTFKVKNQECKIRVKRSDADAKRNSIYWYSSKLHNDVYPEGISSVSADTDLLSEIFYGEHPFGAANRFGAFIDVNVYNDPNNPMTSFGKWKISQDWTWQEFKLTQ